MKKIILGCAVIAAISCQKNISESNELKFSNSANKNSVTLHKNSKFGSSIGGNFSNDDRVEILNNLNAKYVRSSITISEWDGKNSLCDTYAKNGINVILNILNAPLTSCVAFATDMKSYREKLNSITDKYKPEVLVVENEEINPTYHTGPLRDYLKMLKVAVDVCHSKGIKVTNGGIYGPQLEVLTYRYLQTKGQPRADSFANNCMTASQINSAQTPGRDQSLEYKVRQLDTLLRYYHDLDYVNVHLYEPFNPYVDASTVTSATPVVVSDIQEYLIARTGIPVMTNETTPRNNTKPELVTSILNQYDQLNFPYVLWYSNDGESGGEPLYDLKTGELYDNGISFSDFLQDY
jgi:hypothetical protein